MKECVFVGGNKMVMKKAVRETKGKKCDYCDDFAVYKVPDAGLYMYLCENCYANQDQAKMKINESDLL